jgi:hypothetical protein
MVKQTRQTRWRFFQVFRETIKSEKGFSLVEVLASSIVILTVAAFVPQLLQNTQKEINVISEQLAVTDYVNNRFAVIQEDTALFSLAAQKFCSSCNTRPDCAAQCSGTGSAFDLQCQSQSAANAPELDSLINNFPVCFVTITFDPTCDDATQDLAGEDKTRSTQMCTHATIYDSEGKTHENAQTAYFVRM